MQNCIQVFCIARKSPHYLNSYQVPSLHRYRPFNIFLPAQNILKPIKLLCISRPLPSAVSSPYSTISSVRLTCYLSKEGYMTSLLKLSHSNHSQYIFLHSICPCHALPTYLIFTVLSDFLWAL